jgi:hypothetical protein
LRDDRFHRSGLADIARDRQRAYAGPLDLGSGRLEMLQLAACDRDIAARRGERQRDAPTNAGAAARDEGGFAFQEIGLEGID